MISGYENVVVGKLKLKGKPLDVKGRCGIVGGSDCNNKKKKKKLKEHYLLAQSIAGGTTLVSSGKYASASEIGGNDDGRMTAASFDDRLTDAERRFLQQRKKIEMERLARMASKSHRDRIQEFNQYLANLSEHYDIPKVGPG